MIGRQSTNLTRAKYTFQRQHSGDREYAAVNREAANIGRDQTNYRKTLERINSKYDDLPTRPADQYDIVKPSKVYRRIIQKVNLSEPKKKIVRKIILVFYKIKLDLIVVFGTNIKLFYDFFFRMMAAFHTGADEFSKVLTSTDYFLQ